MNFLKSHTLLCETTAKDSLMIQNLTKKIKPKLVVSALGITVASAIIPLKAAQQGAAIAVSATVIAGVKTPTLFEISVLTITNADIAKGYVDVFSAYTFSVFTNSKKGIILDLNPLSNIFESVEVFGMGSTALLGSDGGSFTVRSFLPNNSKHDLSFRFVLSPAVTAGTYPWPLNITARAIT